MAAQDVAGLDLLQGGGNVPQCTHHRLAPETAGALAREPRVLGIKDSAGDFAVFLGYLAIRRVQPVFRVLQGRLRYN